MLNKYIEKNSVAKLKALMIKGGFQTVPASQTKTKTAKTA